VCCLENTTKHIVHWLTDHREIPASKCMATWLNVISITQMRKERMHIFNSFAMCQESQERDVTGSFLCQQGSAKEQHYIKQ